MYTFDVMYFVGLKWYSYTHQEYRRIMSTISIIMYMHVSI